MKARNNRRHELAALRQEVSALRQQVAAGQPSSEPRSSRRATLRLAGAAAVGGAAAVVAGRGSAAATVGFMQYGTTNSAGADSTILSSSSDTVSLRVLNSNEGEGVYGESTGGGTGVRGTVVAPSSVAFGVWGTSLGTLGYGVVASGGQAQVRLVPESTGPGLAVSHVRGEISYDPSGSLWVCVDAGNPGTWRKLGGPATAGALHPIPTARVYDSRWTGVSSPPWVLGTITSGATRVISVADQRNPVAPNTILAAGVVPVGATAVAFNLTVTSTSLNGNLAVEPGNAASAGGSTINWSPGPVALANGSVAKLDGSRQLKIFCGGTPGNSTHFIIDIVGYYL